MNSGPADRTRGMILAAGYGTRLAPITDHIPKPLLPVSGRPLLDLIIESFDAAGVRELAVNTHHLGEQISDHLHGRTDADRFTVFPEAEILGTGGALDGARDFLAASDLFLLHNGDVLCDVDLTALAAEHRASGALATMLLVDWPQVNSVTMDADGAIVSIAGRPAVPAAESTRGLTYSGVGVFSPRLLEDIGPGFSSLVDPLVRAMEADPGCVRGFYRPQGKWDDLGTLPRWLVAQSDAESEIEPAGPARLERITGHGSDRRFWRLATADWSAVAMQGVPDDPEFERQVAIGRFLRAHDLGAPEILDVHEPQKVLLTEDLGPERLYETARRAPDEATPLYEQVLDLLVRLQAATADAHAACPLATDRRLDLAALRWETDYFRVRFLAGHLGLDEADLGRLDDDFAALAAVVAAQPEVLIHRDFQSQNIHVAGGAIRLVDFQGMRLGPLGYDAASLIFDPYVDLGSAQRARLLDRFAAAAATAGAGPDPADGSEVRAMVLAAGLQRLMQALGAYGFLGHVKGKAEFLDHIPAGVARLREVMELIEHAPACRWLPRPLPALGRAVTLS
jgi:aminoglycoside/choline kinase family phosphotransferase